MGVPLFFKFLTQKYPDIIKKYNKNLLKTHELFFDFNGLIHPACSKARKEYYDKNPNNFCENIMYESMFKKIKEHTASIIKLIEPTDYILLAVDGVAPLAKINQQRSRRYKSHVLSSKINQIKERYKVVPDKWDTNAISPGTPFMNKLMTDLEQYVKLVNNDNNKFNIELSDSNQPGEGEHKIINYIKTKQKNNVNKIIYGLDADLIMLSVASGVDNIYLLRESVHFGKVSEDDDDYLLLDIDCLKFHLCNEIRSFLIKGNISDRQILVDYLFICFMVGNDFIPHLPPLHIGEGSIDFLLETYGGIISDKSIITDNYTINKEVFQKFIRKISEEEDIMVKSFYKSYIRKKYGDRYSKTPYEKEIRQFDFLPMTTKVVDTIQFNLSDWDYRYYCRYLNTHEVTKLDIDKVCKSYYEGLEWNLKYYFDTCTSWRWFYKYTCSPTAMDLYKYVLKTEDPTVFTTEKALKPIEQLLCILPPSSCRLLPKKYQFLMTSTNSPIRDLYPKSFKLEMLYKRYFHECIPKLPNINYKRIINEVIKLN